MLRREPDASAGRALDDGLRVVRLRVKGMAGDVDHDDVGGGIVIAELRGRDAAECV